MTLPLWVWDWVPLAREVNWYLRETRRLRNRDLLVAPIRDMHLLAYNDLEVLEAVIKEVPWSVEDSVYIFR